MGLTPEQITLLEKPFALNEHDYTPQGEPYIKKSALRHRLRQVDPSYQMGPQELLSADSDLIMMRGSLTVCGCTVYGVGIGKITREKTDGTIITGAKLTNEVAKANKQAASDILPRAAVELNCGAYLKDKPRDIKKDKFADWLAKLAGSFSTHWAANGGRDRAQAMLIELGMKWVDVHTLIEPGKVLNRLEETTLSEPQFYLRLIDLRQPAQPKTADASH